MGELTVKLMRRFQFIALPGLSKEKYTVGSGENCEENGTLRMGLSCLPVPHNLLHLPPPTALRNSTEDNVGVCSRTGELAPTHTLWLNLRIQHLGSHEPILLANTLSSGGRSLLSLKM